MSNKEASKAILKGIQNLIKEELKKAPVDQTLTGVVKEVKEDNLYDVYLGGILYTNVPSMFTGLKINNTVKIKVPQNQYSQMYIEGKYNMQLNSDSGGGGTVVNPDFNIGDGLKLDSQTNTLSVDTTNDVEENNTKPITSSGVFSTLGNIDELLKTI